MIRLLPIPTSKASSYQESTGKYEVLISSKTGEVPAAKMDKEKYDFEYYLDNLEIKEETADGRVPDTSLFCLDKDRNIFVGAVNIRHYLNEGHMEQRYWIQLYRREIRGI